MPQMSGRRCHRNCSSRQCRSRFWRWPRAGRSHAGLTESGFPVRLTGKDLARLVDDAGDRLREAAPALDADGKASGHRYCR
jgi:hypothetical protein